MLVQRLTFLLRNGIGIPQLAREFYEGFAIAAGERRRARANDIDMIEFETLGPMSGHEADGIFVAGSHRNRSASLAKILHVLQKFAQFPGSGDGLFLPGADEFHDRVCRRRTSVEGKATDDDFHCPPAFCIEALDFLADFLHLLQNSGARFNLRKYREEIGIFGSRPHGRSQLYWINAELGQSSDTEEASSICWKHDRTQASQYVTNLWRI